jgi:hypothetical protein
MREQKFYGNLITGSADFLPILYDVLDKYGIHDFEPGLEALAEIAGAEEKIDLAEVRQEIANHIWNTPEIFGTAPALIIKIFNKKEENNLEFEELESIPDPTLREQVHGLLLLVTKVIEPQYLAIQGVIEGLADHLFEYLLTGEAQELPEAWIGVADKITMYGQDVVMAMANRAADPREVSKKFMGKFEETFGTRRSMITRSHARNTDYIRMWMSGRKLKDIVDVYIERHPSEFPRDIDTQEYKAARKHKLNDMKIMLGRAEKRLVEIWGTGTKND